MNYNGIGRYRRQLQLEKDVEKGFVRKKNAQSPQNNVSFVQLKTPILYFINKILETLSKIEHSKFGLKLKWKVPNSETFFLQ